MRTSNSNAVHGFLSKNYSMRKLLHEIFILWTRNIHNLRHYTRTSLPDTKYGNSDVTTIVLLLTIGKGVDPSRRVEQVGPLALVVFILS